MHSPPTVLLDVVKLVHVTELDGSGVLKEQKPQLFELEKSYSKDGQVKFTVFKLKSSFWTSTSKLITGVVSKAEVTKKILNVAFQM